MRHVSCVLLTCTLLSGSAFAAESSDSAPAVANTEPDATLVFRGGAVAAGIGYVWGKGELTYQGRDHQFTVSGLSLVDAGASSLSASGVVYNLHRLEDLTGNYVAASAGMALGGGATATYLKNEHGVVIKLIATSVGVQFTLAANGVHVELKG